MGAGRPRTAACTPPTSSGVVELYAWDRDDRQPPAGHRPAQRHARRHAVARRRDGLVVRRHRRRRVRRLDDRAVRRRRRTPSPCPRSRPAYPAGLEVGRDAGRRSAGPPTTAASCGWPRRRPAAGDLPARGRRPRSTPCRTTTTLLVMSHSEHGDPRYPALRVLRVAGTTRSPRRRRREVGRRGPRPARARPSRPLPGDRRLLVAPRAPRPRGAADLGRRHRHRDRARARPARRRRRRLVPRRHGAAGRATTTRPAPSCTATTWPPACWRSWTPRRASSAGPPRGPTARWSWRGRPRSCRRSSARADGPVVLSVARRGAAAGLPGRGPLGARPRRRRARAARPAARARRPYATVFLRARRARGGRRRLLPRRAGRPTSTPASPWCT